MTTRTSFFNKGIYKSTIKRNLWGSILYFIFLFMSTTLGIILYYGAADTGLDIVDYYRDYSLILSSGNIMVPLLFTMVVPTVAGLLVFRFMHSKKTSIFTHSLPVSREANFISSACAGLTLMAAPVILNGIILALLSAGGYGVYFTIKDCAIWIGINLFSLFLMFSCTCFAASITGNSFAMVVLNILTHTVLLILTSCSMLVTGKFLYGFSYSNSIVEALEENTFPTMVFKLFDYDGVIADVKVMDFVLPIICAIVIYIAALILYKKRHNETVSDVAGFKVLNPIFKYLVTIIAALVTFSAFSAMVNATVFVIVAIIGAVAYFGIEMLLKKTFRVWGSYKGFLVVSALFAIFIVLISQTNFFGYETRIPDAKNVKKISLSGTYDYIYYDEELPTFDDEETIKLVMESHKDLIENRAEADLWSGYDIMIAYELKNGGKLLREYSLPYERYCAVMDTLYKSLEYKKENEEIFGDFTEITSMSLADEENYITDKTHQQEIVECLRKDIENLSYAQLQERGLGVEIVIGRVVPADIDDEYYEYYTKVDSNYKNTYAYLKEHGYWGSWIKNEGKIYIVKDKEEIPYMRDGEVDENPAPDKEKKAIKFEGDAAQTVIDYILAAPYEAQEENQYYVYQVTEDTWVDIELLAVLSENQVQDLIK